MIPPLPPLPLPLLPKEEDREDNDDDEDGDEEEEEEDGWLVSVVLMVGGSLKTEYRPNRPRAPADAYLYHSTYKHTQKVLAH